MFNDEKIQLIESMPNGDALVLIWVKLLTLAGKSNQLGIVNVTCNVTYTNEMLSVLLKKPLEQVKQALTTFEMFGMIEICDKGIYITNWEKHQNTDALERMKVQTRERVKRHRLKSLLDNNSLNSNVTETLHVTQSNAIDKERRKKNKNENKRLYLDSIYLSEDEFNLLLEKYRTIEKVNKAIEVLNNYLESTGKKYRSHYHVLIGWVYDKLNEQKGSGKPNTIDVLQNLYDEAVAEELKKVHG
jgi:predicted phage replisome organizer